MYKLKYKTGIEGQTPKNVKSTDRGNDSSRRKRLLDITVKIECSVHAHL